MQSMNNIRHFIWDFDGTLFNTYPTIIHCVQLALADFGHTADSTEMMELMLDNIPFAIHHYADLFGIEYDTLHTKYVEHRKPYLESLAAPPMPDVVAVLKKITDTGRNNYIFTHRKPEETANYLCHWSIDGFFCDMVAPGTEGFAVKPAPDAVNYLSAKYNMQPEETVMLGDREVDLGSGRNGGILTAHIVCAAVPQTLHCDWRFESFQQMLALL